MLIKRLIVDADGLMVHEKSYYMTVTAVNKVGLQSYSFSGPISIDVTPPISGKVVDLHTTYRIDVNDNTATVQMNAKACTTDAGTDPSKCINDLTLRSDTEFCRTSLLKLSDKCPTKSSQVGVRVSTLR